MNPYIKIALVFIFSGLVIFLALTLDDRRETIIENNYETKYDSLKQQLEFQRTTRTALSNTIDSLLVANDSLGNLSKQIEYKIVKVPGTYKQYNSEELRQKMIEGYNAGQVN